MIMILQFNKEMNPLNKFFKKFYSTPSLLWKIGAALIFFFFSLSIAFLPNLTIGFTDSSRLMFAGLLFVYSLFRFYTFYAEYKSYEDEE